MAMIRLLAVVAVIYFPWLMFNSSVFVTKAVSNPNGQDVFFGKITSAKDDSALKAELAAGP